MTYRAAVKFSDVERRVMENPDYYVACAFRGRAIFDRKEAPTFEELMKVAEDLYEDRPVGLYAITQGYQAMIGTWVP